MVLKLIIIQSMNTFTCNTMFFNRIRMRRSRSQPLAKQPRVSLPDKILTLPAILYCFKLRLSSNQRFQMIISFFCSYRQTDFSSKYLSQMAFATWPIERAQFPSRHSAKTPHFIHSNVFCYAQSLGSMDNKTGHRSRYTLLRYPSTSQPCFK